MVTKSTGFRPWSLLQPPIVRVSIKAADPSRMATMIRRVTLQDHLSRLGWITAWPGLTFRTCARVANRTFRQRRVHQFPGPLGTDARVGDLPQNAGPSRGRGETVDTPALGAGGRR